MITRAWCGRRKFMLLLLWPAVAATTFAQNRLIAFDGLAIVVLASAIAIRVPAALGATAVAALAFTAASANPRKADAGSARFGAVSFILAPAIPLLSDRWLAKTPFAPLLSLKIMGWHTGQ